MLKRWKKKKQPQQLEYVYVVVLIVQGDDAAHTHVLGVWADKQRALAFIESAEKNITQSVELYKRYEVIGTPFRNEDSVWSR